MLLVIRTVGRQVRLTACWAILGLQVQVWTVFSQKAFQFPARLSTQGLMRANQPASVYT